jgi:hypothetical protein
VIGMRGRPVLLRNCSLLHRAAFGSDRGRNPFLRWLQFGATGVFVTEPENEIFVSFGQSALIPGTTFEPQSSQLSIRLGQTLRF